MQKAKAFLNRFLKLVENLAQIHRELISLKKEVTERLNFKDFKAL